MENSLSTIIDSSNKLGDEDLCIATKNWNKLVTTSSTVGYKEGIEDGEESVYQEGFDTGFKDAFNVAFTLGRYKGLMSSIQQNAQLPSNINSILNETKKGICYICNKEKQNKNLDGQIENMQFADILKEQKTYSTNVLKTLYKHFKPIMSENNIDDHKLAFDK